MMHALPFLKKRKLPAAKMEDREVGLSSNEELEDHAMGELMDAAESRDPRLFRQAMEALVMNSFDGESDEE